MPSLDRYVVVECHLAAGKGFRYRIGQVVTSEFFRSLAKVQKGRFRSKGQKGKLRHTDKRKYKT